MTDPFLGYVRQHGLDADTIQQATRYYLAEITNDRLPEELIAEIEEATGDPQAVAAALEALEANPEELERCCMALLSDAWEQTEERDRVRGALAEAKDALPVVEVGILAAVALYALWLHYNKAPPVGETRERKELRPDGSLLSEKSTKYQPPPGPLAAIVKLLRSPRASSGT